MQKTLPNGKWRKRLKIKALPPFAELHKVRAGNYKIFISNYWQLWFEEFEGKNYIFNVDRLSGSSDYFLTVQLIQDRKLYPVMNYLLLDRKVCKYEKADPEYYIDFH